MRSFWIVCFLAVTTAPQPAASVERAALHAAHEVDASRGSDFEEIIIGVRPRGFGQGEYMRRYPAGGKTYYVSVDGSDAASGTKDSPFRTITRAAEIAAAGDVVNIRDGQYEESVFVRNSGTPTKPIVFQAENRGGVVLSGGRYTFQPADWYGGKRVTGQFHIRLRGLIFRDYGDPHDKRYAASAVRPGKYWVIEDCLFDRAGRTGITIVEDYVTVTRSTLQYHYIQAIAAWGRGGTDPVRGLRIEDIVLRGNYTAGLPVDGATSSTVTKLGGTKGATVDNLESYENNGSGLWFDADNSNYTVRNSYLHHNTGRGLHLELGWGSALIENNVIANNGHEGVAISNSWGLELRHNLIVRNRECIRISDWVARSGSAGQYATRDVSIHGNYFKDWAQNGCISPLGDRPGGLSSSAGISSSKVQLDRNLYDPGRSSSLSWWSDRGFINTISEAQEMGMEQNGRIAKVRLPEQLGR